MPQIPMPPKALERPRRGVHRHTTKSETGLRFFISAELRWRLFLAAGMLLLASAFQRLMTLKYGSHSFAAASNASAYVVVQRLQPSGLLWPPGGNDSVFSRGRPLHWQLRMPLVQPLLHRLADPQAGESKAGWPVWVSAQPHVFEVNTSSTACRPEYAAVFSGGFNGCEPRHMAIKVPGDQLAAFFNQTEDAAFGQAQPLPAAATEKCPHQRGYIHLLLPAEQLLGSQAVQSLQEQRILLSDFSDTRRAQFLRSRNATDEPAAVTTDAFASHNGTSLQLAWSTAHRFITVTEGRAEVLLFSGSELPRLATVPPLHARAGQSLFLQQTDSNVSIQLRPRATAATLVPGGVVYVPPGWVVLILPQSVTVALVSSAPSLADTVQQSILADLPAPLLDHSVPLSRRVKWMRVYVEELSDLMSDSLFEVPSIWLKQRYALGLRTLQAVDHFETPTRQPRLSCGSHQPDDAENTELPPERAAEALAAMRVEIRNARQNYLLLPDSVRPHLTLQYIDTLLEAAFGLPNVFVFWESCF